MNIMYAQNSSALQKRAKFKTLSISDSSSQSESLQRKADMVNNAAQRAESSQPSNTGMPDNLKPTTKSSKEIIQKMTCLPVFFTNHVRVNARFRTTRINSLLSWQIYQSLCNFTPPYLGPCIVIVVPCLNIYRDGSTSESKCAVCAEWDGVQYVMKHIDSPDRVGRGVTHIYNQATGAFDYSINGQNMLNLYQYHP